MNAYQRMTIPSFRNRVCCGDDHATPGYPSPPHSNTTIRAPLEKKVLTTIPSITLRREWEGGGDRGAVHLLKLKLNLKYLPGDSSSVDRSLSRPSLVPVVPDCARPAAGSAARQVIAVIR